MLENERETESCGGGQWGPVVFCVWFGRRRPSPELLDGGPSCAVRAGRRASEAPFSLTCPKTKNPDTIFSSPSIPPPRLPLETTDNRSTDNNSSSEM